MIGAADAHVYSLDDEKKALRHEVAFSAGDVVAVLEDHPYGYPGASLPVADFPGWSDLIARPDPQFLHVSDSALTLNAYEWHQARGHRSVLLSALMAAGKPIGLLVVAFSDREEVTQSQCEVYNTLAQQVTLILHMSRLAEDAKRSAVAQERAHEALQKMIDALDSLQDFSEVLPRALRIVAHAFDAKNCAYFEQDDDQVVHLRYWLVQDRLLSPEGFLKEMSEHDPTVQRIVNGFSVKTEYLGSSPTDRARAVMIDHLAGTCEPDFDAFANAHGWGVELNVPVVSGFSARGALTIYRGPGATFTPSEIQLAELLAKQLALAMEASWLSAESRQCAVENAVSQEREKAAQDHVSELAKANAAFRRSASAVSDSHDFRDAVGQVFRELVVASDACTAHLFGYDSQSNTLKTEFSVQDGEFRRGSDETAAPLLRAAFDADVIPAFRAFVESREIFTMNLLQADDAAKAMVRPGVIDWHLQNGRKCACAIPLFSGDSPLGMICLACREPASCSQEHRELLSALANQTSLVMQLIALAESRQIVALAEERQRSAQELAAQLTKANEALRKSIAELATYSKLDSYLVHVLAAIRELTGATVVNLLRCSEDASTVSLIIASTLGRHVDIFSAPEYEVYRQPIVLDEKHAEMRTNLQNAPGCWWVYADDPLLSPDVQDWLRRHKHESVACLALRKGAGPLGMLALTFPEVHRHEFPGMDVVTVLANQVALALELHRLAEAERSAAIAAEREKGAEERTAELATANDALTRSIDSLTSPENLPRFVVNALRGAICRCGADSGAIFLHDLNADTLNAIAIILRGENLDQVNHTRVQPMYQGVPGSLGRIWERVSVRREIVWEDMSANPPDSWPHVTELFVRTHHRYAASIPMVLEGSVIGFLGIAFDESKELELSSSLLELFRVMALHATLALQVARLAERAKRTAVAEERARLAGDIHDTLAQGFVAIGIQVQASEREGRTIPPEVQKHLDVIRELARSNLTEARRSIRALRPAELTQGGIEAALQRVVECSQTQSTARIIPLIGENLPTLPRHVEDHLLRIAQEAITNSLKHAEAKLIQVSLTSTAGGGVSLKVIDDGKGFEANSTSAGYGLLTIQERAARIGATVTVVTEPGFGTEIIAAWAPSAESPGAQNGKA